MTAGAELIAVDALPVKLGHFVEICLFHKEYAISHSAGRDEYHVFTTIPAGNRFAGSGRLCICQVELTKLGVGPMEVRPAKPVYVSESLSDYDLHVRTNIFLSAEDFQRSTLIRIIENNKSMVLRPGSSTGLYCPRPGQFIINIG
ncbi:MAG: hypothetical protein FH749_04910 [Firmicutes bacterium]|nr:hypothetical protein [Bacillota bacterium]